MTIWLVNDPWVFHSPRSSGGRGICLPCGRLRRLGCGSRPGRASGSDQMRRLFHRRYPSHHLWGYPTISPDGKYRQQSRIRSGSPNQAGTRSIRRRQRACRHSCCRVGTGSHPQKESKPCHRHCTECEERPKPITSGNQLCVVEVRRPCLTGCPRKGGDCRGSNRPLASCDRAFPEGRQILQGRRPT